MSKGKPGRTSIKIPKHDMSAYELKQALDNMYNFFQKESGSPILARKKMEDLKILPVGVDNNDINKNTDPHYIKGFIVENNHLEFS